MDEELMQAMRNRLENKLRSGWRTAMREVKDANTLRDIQAAITSTGTYQMAGVEEAIAEYASDVAAGYVYAGQRAARAIDAAIDTTFRFDIADDAAIEWMQTTAREIAEAVMDDLQATTDRVIQWGRINGDDEAAIAEDVLNSVGLGTSQVDQVQRYRELLEEGDYQTAVSYELADGRYDAALERADEEGTFFGEERIGSMVDRYRDNWARLRADGIALDGANETTNAGVAEAFTQAADKGLVRRDDTMKRWVSRGDSRVRPGHRRLHGVTIQIDEPFQSLDGEINYPGDPDASVENTAGCRCLLVITVGGEEVTAEEADAALTDAYGDEEAEKAYAKSIVAPIVKMAVAAMLM